MTKTSTNVAIIGAGIAGSWLAYRLAQHGIETVVIRSDTADTPTVSQGAAAVINRSLLEDTSDLASLFVDETGTQHPELQPLLRRYFRQEFDALSRLVAFMPFEDAVIPKHSHPVPRLGAGGEVVSLILERFVALGGSVMQGRVTHLAVTDGVCYGLQYEQQGEPHILQCQALVMATGGFSGLMPVSATGNAGAILGMFAQCGGTLSNLEFFYRFAFGDVSNGRVLYPEDLQGSRMYRAGSRAQWLERASATIPEERRDLAIFQQYWVHNLDVPHVLERGGTSFSLGPINGYSMGGIAHSQGATTIRNLYTTGEASHSLAADCIVGKPWACSLATAGLLCDLLSERSGAEQGPAVQVMPVPLPVQPSLLHEVKRRLRAFQDHRFSEGGAQNFVEWCRSTRHHLPPERMGCFAVLLLTEAYALSVLARRESIGFFFRGDFPNTNSNLRHHTTMAYYDAANDGVVVELVPNHVLGERIQRTAPPDHITPQ